MTPRRGRGQSLAEFALTVPMALLMVLFGLDFGRVFLGWVALNNAAREAANYAALNPKAWTAPFNVAVQTEYERLVNTETSNINCALKSGVAAPTFASGTSLGAPASVKLTCQFSLLTPFLGVLMGNPIAVSASSAFPIRTGLIESIPTPSPTATATATSSASASPSGSPDDSPSPSPSPAPSGSGAPPTPTPSPTPPTCTVVSLLNQLTSRAQSDWANAGFTGTVVFTPLVPPHYRIAWQSLTVGTTVDCSSGINVRSGAP